MPRRSFNSRSPLIGSLHGSQLFFPQEEAEWFGSPWGVDARLNPAPCRWCPEPWAGSERVHFEAPAGERIPHEMKRFLLWLEQDQGLDPVLTADIAHFWFVTIHPFEDGNGRIGRAIADLLLARGDGMAERFYSLSSQIETDRKEYYEKLEACQRGTLDITLWLRWFLECFGRVLKGVKGFLEQVLRKVRLWERINQGHVNDRQRAVPNRLLDGFEGKLTSSKYSKLAKCLPDTALRDIQYLVSRGIMLQRPS